MPPCVLTFDSTVVRSYSAAEADSLDLRAVRAVDRGGQFYIQGYTPGRVTILSPRGDFVARFGRTGEGPGEIASGNFDISISDLDSIYVQDNRLRVTVFGPEGRFVRVMPLGAMPRSKSRYCLLADGTRIGALQPKGPGRAPTLALFNAAGETVTEFGYSALDASPPREVRSERRVFCGFDSTVWVTPSSADPGFHLERFDVEGSSRQRIVREAGWFVPGPELSRSEMLTSRPSSAVRSIFELRRGLLLVLVTSADAEWSPLTREEWESRQGEILDARIEVMDAFSKRVLATLTVDDVGEFPDGWIQADGSSYDFVVDETGGTTLMKYTFHLKDR